MRSLKIMRGSERAVGSYAAPILGFFILTLCFVRLFFSIDFTDESYQVALTYRAFLGDRFFADEWTANQFFALLTQPVFNFYYYLRGSTDGVVLFSRVLYFFANLLAGGAIFAFARRFLTWPAAFLLSLTPVLFLPFGLNLLGYNAIYCAFLAFGLFVGAIAQQADTEHEARVLRFLSGAAYGIAIVSIPTAVVPVACILFLSAHGKISGRMGTLLPYGLGILAILLPLLPQFGYIDGHFLAGSLRHATADAQGVGLFAGWRALQKVIFISRQLLELWTPALPVCALLLGLPFIRPDVRKSKIWQFSLAVFPLLLLRGRERVSTLLIVIEYALLAPIFYLLLTERKPFQSIFRIIYLPSLVAGAAAAWTSANGLVNAGLGLFPGVVVSGILHARVLRELSSGEGTTTGTSERLGLLALGSLCLVLTFYQQVVFNDSPIRELRWRVNRGPFHGLFTTQERVEFLDGLQDDLDRVVAPGARVLFFPFFSAGYLMIKGRPLTHSIWGYECPRQDCRDEFEFDLRTWTDPRNLVVRLWKVPDNVNEIREPGRRTDLLFSEFQPLLVRPQYTILATH